jgi:hypothetical protein
MMKSKSNNKREMEIVESPYIHPDLALGLLMKFDFFTVEEVKETIDYCYAVFGHSKKWLKENNL